MKFGRGLVIVTAGAILLLSQSRGLAVSYSLIDLGAASEVYGMNNLGQVVGDAGGSPFVYSNGVMSGLSLSGAPHGAASGINDLGQIVGWVGNNSLSAQATVWQNGSPSPLGNLGGQYSSGYGINNAGQAVGWALTPNGETHAFLSQNGAMTDLGTLPNGSYSVAEGINSSGQAVGLASANGGVGGPMHAFSYVNGSMTDLGTLGGGTSFTSSINNSGQIAGGATLSDGSTHAFLYSNGAMSDLDTLGAPNSRAVAINNHGRVAGISYNPNAGEGRAFVYQNGSMQHLDTLVDSSGAGWSLKSVAGINDEGQIAGIGTNPQGQRHAFLVTPTLEEPPRTFGVFIGSNDYTLGFLPKVNGKADAQKVRQKFAALSSLTSVYLSYDVSDNQSDAIGDIYAALASFTSQIRPGDNLIFFYSGHGFGSTTSLSAGESLVVNEGNGLISDDDFAAWFSDSSRKSKWDSVNKLFLLDSCFSEGFWNGEPGDKGDLSGLPKSALLAAAGELEESLGSKNPLRFGEGYFSIALEDGLTMVDGFALADTNHDGLTFDDLRTFLLQYPNYENGLEGYIKTTWTDDLITRPWSIASSQSPDFALNLPEPAILPLIVGGCVMLRRRSRFAAI